MKRRTFIQSGLAVAFGAPLLAALKQERLNDAAGVLGKAVTDGQVASAVLHVNQRDATFTRHFGKAASDDAMFLLGSITKPLCVTALMTLFDKGEFSLDDPLKKFIPQFAGERRDRVTLQHLLTHTSGLPDQLPENDALRKSRAGLTEFVEHAIRVPLSFDPGTRYQYSSMGILLATHVARLIRGVDILEFVDRSVFQPLGMKHAALGLGRFAMNDLVSTQVEHAAPEAGGGDPNAKDWDWNSAYWRKLGAPWGGAHVSAPDLGRWLADFLFKKGVVVKPETATLMTSNRNGAAITPRGLGFGLGAAVSSPGCSEKTFGHTGSTGTIAWADPATEMICVVLTSLPSRAVRPHPLTLASAQVAEAAR